MAEAVIRLLRHHQPRSLSPSSPSSPSSSSSSHLESSINSTTFNLTFLSHQLRLSENDSRPPPPFSFTYPTDLNSTFFFDDDESSSSLSSTSSSSSLFSEQLSNALLIFSYSLIVLISLFGNTFVCRVMLSLKGANRTRTNFLILNLALSDLLLTTFNIPVNIIRFVSSDWPFGELICKATPFIQSLSAHCSAITMMIIAYERHSRLIGTNPATALWRILKRLLCSCLSWLSTRLAQSLRNSTGSGGNSSETQTYLRNSSANSSTNSNGSSHQNGGQVAISIPGGNGGGNGGGQSHSVINTGSGSSFRLPTPVLIIIIWLVSALLSSPHGLVNKVVIYQGVFHDMTRCQAKYPSAGFHTFLSVVTPISQYLAPIGATALFYARIGHFLWRRTDPVGVVSEGRRQSILRRKRKRVKMLVVVVVVFAVCWAPLHFYVTLVDFGIIQINFAIYFCVHWFACSSVVWNPFIYCWLNETFRRKMTPLLAVFRPFKVCVERLLALCSCCFAAGRRKGNKATPAGGAAAVCQKGGRSASTVISTTADGQCAVVEVESVKTSSSISSSSSTKNLHCCSGGGGGGFMSAICGGTKEGVGVRASIKTFSSGGGGGGGDHHKPPRGGPRRPSASSACSGSGSGGEGSSPPVETTMVTATAILEMGEMFEEVENNEQQQQQQLKQ